MHDAPSRLYSPFTVLLGMSYAWRQPSIHAMLVHPTELPPVLLFIPCMLIDLSR